MTLNSTAVQITDSRLEFSALKVLSPSPIATVDREGHVFVYTWGGEKMDTGVVMHMPLPYGQEAVYEVLRVLGLKCAAISKTNDKPE